MTTETKVPTPGSIQTASSSTFSSLVLEAKGAIAVEFLSYGCSHCKDMEPILEEVAKLLENQVRVFRVNVGVDQDLAEEYGIQGTPTLVMFKDGQIVGEEAGPAPSVASLTKVLTKPFEL